MKVFIVRETRMDCAPISYPHVDTGYIKTFTNYEKAVKYIDDRMNRKNVKEKIAYSNSVEWDGGLMKIYVVQHALCPVFTTFYFEIIEETME